MAENKQTKTVKKNTEIVFTVRCFVMNQLHNEGDRIIIETKDLDKYEGVAKPFLAPLDETVELPA